MKHRALGQPALAAYPIDFVPAHCAGTSCFHDHPGEPVLPVFLSVMEPPVRCDRKHVHGSHDIATDRGDFRCPGLAAFGLPAPRVVQRAAQARAAIRGGAR